MHWLSAPGAGCAKTECILCRDRYASATHHPRAVADATGDRPQLSILRVGGGLCWISMPPASKGKACRNNAAQTVVYGDTHPCSLLARTCAISVMHTPHGQIIGLLSLWLSRALGANRTAPPAAGTPVFAEAMRAARPCLARCRPHGWRACQPTGQAGLAVCGPTGVGM